MKKVGDILSGEESTLPENGKTSLSPNPDTSAQSPLDFLCRDPENADLPCPICDGRGVYSLDVPLSDVRYGKFQRCPNHAVQNDLAMQERLRRFGNLQSYRDKTFERFETEFDGGGSYPPNVISSLEAAKRKAQSFGKRPRGWIVFEGPHGCGKTHLAVAIANTRLEQMGEQVIFTTAPDLLDFLRSSLNVGGDTRYDDYFERIRNVATLVLDDLGVENPSAWAKEKLFQILNYRHVNKLPTVITTNTALDELDPWIGSRMMDADVVEHIAIIAPDYRRNTRSDYSDRRFNNLQLYQHMNFETFSVKSAIRAEAANLTKAKALAQTWVRNPARWLCFMGESGCGKTHLAASIANNLTERGKDFLIIAVPDLLDYLRLSFEPRANSRFDKRFHDIVNKPILILDHLSTASATPWAKEKLFQIIDYRYLSRSPTVFTTLESMSNIDPRLASRLMDGKICDIFFMDVPSYVERQKHSF